MCGITGIFSTNNITISFPDLLDRLKHRGPDDTGIYSDTDIGLYLGHSRLSILDTSDAGHQPMHDITSNVILIYNGEIYNFKELRKILIQNGYIFNSNTDTEVLLNMYLFYRDKNEGFVQMLNQLNGIFAFAIWDADKEKLLLARDGLGVKPLYYSNTNDGFSFASEIKGLHLPSNRTSNTNVSKMFQLFNVNAIERYLTFLWCPGNGTPHKYILKLEPGHAISVSNGRLDRIFPWYKHPFINHNKNSFKSKNTTDFFIQKTENLLRQAVHRQLVSDVPIGAFLSGGLDSSSIVALTREVNPDIHCFTIEGACSKEEGVVDDLPYARQAAKHLGVKLDVVQIDSSKIADDLVKMVHQLDEPLADIAPLNVLYISRFAKERGLKVLLSGAGGDDLFTGYRRHLALTKEKYVSWLPNAVLEHLERFTKGLDMNCPVFRRLAKFFNGSSLDGDDRIINYFRWIDRTEVKKLYSRDFKNALGKETMETPLLEYLEKLPANLNRLNRMLALEQRFFLSDHNLNYTDKMSMAEGIEVRVPFLDLDLVNFASTLPINLKQKGKEGKWILKKAMEPYLPKEIIYRSKSGFGAPLRKWMKNDFKDLLGEYLSPHSIKNRGFFDPLKIQELIELNTSGKVDASYTLFSVLCLEIWCRHFIDS